MRRLPCLALAATLSTLLAGCHSAYINTTVTNHTAKPIELLEVDYPSASFGTQNLAPGGVFHYRFKILGSRPHEAPLHRRRPQGPHLCRPLIQGR